MRDRIQDMDELAVMNAKECFSFVIMGLVVIGKK
jgi:hypothetical protein